MDPRPSNDPASEKQQQPDIRLQPPVPSALPSAEVAPLLAAFSAEPLTTEQRGALLSALSTAVAMPSASPFNPSLHMFLRDDFSSWLQSEALSPEGASPSFVRLGNPLPGAEAIYGGTKFGEQGTPVPAHYFALTPSAIAKLAAIPEAEFSWREIYRTLMERPSGALTPFTREAFNLANGLYFGAPGAFDEGFAPSAVFTRDETVNRALGRFLHLRSMPLQRPLRVKELCCGKDVSRWAPVAAGCPSALEVTLSDFAQPALPDVTALSGVLGKVDTAVDNLLEGFTPLPEESRYDVLFTTYGVDSLVLRGDAHYERLNGEWFEYRYRVTAPDDHRAAHLPSPDAESAIALQLSAAEAARLRMEVAPFPLDPEDVPDRALLETFLDGPANGRFAYPGGLVASVVEAFETQLRPDGAFIVGDLGSFNPAPLNAAGAILFATSGAGAKYHPIDFFLARQLLMERGFLSSVLPVTGFVDRMSSRESPPDPAFDRTGWQQHYFLVVERARR